MFWKTRENRLWQTAPSKETPIVAEPLFYGVQPPNKGQAEHLTLQIAYPLAASQGFSKAGCSPRTTCRGVKNPGAIPNCSHLSA